MDIRIKKLYDHWFDFRFRVWEFEKLYSEDPYNIELREKTAPDFFRDINQLYWDNFLITIARLLDLHIQGQNTNLTLFTLVQILKENDIDDYKTIDCKVSVLKKKHKDILNFRRKHLAHLDSDYSTGLKEFNTSTHIDEVIAFLDTMVDLINETLGYLGEDEQAKNMIYPGRYYGSQALINILEKDYKAQLQCSEDLRKKLNEIK